MVEKNIHGIVSIPRPIMAILRLRKEQSGVPIRRQITRAIEATLSPDEAAAVGSKGGTA